MGGAIKVLSQITIMVMTSSFLICVHVCVIVYELCAVYVCVRWALIVVGSWHGGVATPQSTRNPRPRKNPETSRRNQQVNSEEAAPTEAQGTRRSHPSVGSAQSHRVPLTRDPPGPKADVTPQSFLMATGTVLILSTIYPPSLSLTHKRYHETKGMLQKQKDYSFPVYTLTVLRPGSLRKGW